jgi:hypothetical protein
MLEIVLARLVEREQVPQPIERAVRKARETSI